MDDPFIAVEHVGKGVDGVGLNLEVVGMVGEVCDDVREWQHSVDEEQEKYVVIIQKVIWFVG